MDHTIVMFKSNEQRSSPVDHVVVTDASLTTCGGGICVRACFQSVCLVRDDGQNAASTCKAATSDLMPRVESAGAS